MHQFQYFQLKEKLIMPLRVFQSNNIPIDKHCSTKKETKNGKLARCLKKENKKWYVGTKAQSLDNLSNLAAHLHHISSFFQFNSQAFFPTNSYSILILSNVYGIEHLNVCAIEHLIFKIAIILEILQIQYH